ncbi:MAG TPA: helix-turn-helix domain-containing protein [Candidatus Aminicenantes bacterium]|nr:helix-turn-helix domain-containing protein [Candidatus Aminicenantes bacterium]
MNVYLQRYLGLEEGRGFARPAGFPTLRTLERDYISFLLEVTDQNRAEVSRILAISRSTLYHKIRRYRMGEEGPERLTV